MQQDADGGSAAGGCSPIERGASTVAKQQALSAGRAGSGGRESKLDEVFDDPEGDRITLPLVELQIGAALVAVALGGATLVAVRRRRSSVL